MGEEQGSWIVNYLPEEGGRFTGHLTVATETVEFVSLYESSNATIIKAIFLDVGSFAAAGGHTVYRYSNDKEARIELPTSDIAGVEGVKAGMMKRVKVSMSNGETFVFDYGLLSTKKIVKAIESVI